MKKLLLIIALLSLTVLQQGCQYDRTVTTRGAIFRSNENGPDNKVSDSRRAGMSTGTGWAWGKNK